MFVLYNINWPESSLCPERPRNQSGLAFLNYWTDNRLAMRRETEKTFKLPAELIKRLNNYEQSVRVKRPNARGAHIVQAALNLFLAQDDGSRWTQVKLVLGETDDQPPLLEIQNRLSKAAHSARAKQKEQSPKPKGGSKG